MIRALAIICLLASAAEAKMPCVSGPMRARPITRTGEHVAGSGGVIVVGESLPDWRFRVLNKIVRPRVVTLAPGLAIYHPPPLPGDEVVLEDGEHEIQVRATLAFSVGPTLSAPDVSSVTTTTGDYIAVRARFAVPVPVGARAVIVSRFEGGRSTPLAWTFVWGGSDVIQLYGTPGGCTEHVSGWVAPKRGERVVLAWVDGTGRVSEPSRPIRITGVKP